MARRKGIKEIVGLMRQNISTIVSNQNPQTETMITKKKIEKVVGNLNDALGPQNPLVIEEDSGFISISLVSPQPEKYKFLVCSLDLRFGDLTNLTEEYISGRILNGLSITAKQSSM